MKRRYVIGTACAAALAFGLGTAGARPTGRPVVYGASLLNASTGTWSFEQVDARTLRPVRHGAHFGRPAREWSFSPNRKELALGPTIFDLATLRVARRISIQDVDLFTSVWLRPDLLEGVGAEDAEDGGYELVTADPRSGAVRTQTPLDVTFQDDVVYGVTRAADGIAFLLVSLQSGAPTTLVVAGPDGSVRKVVLGRIGSGFVPGAGQAGYSIPAFAVDAAGGRAFVTAAGDPVAEIDLASLGVTYHERVAAFAGASGAKRAAGAVRAAAYLPGGLLALTGSSATAAAGLALVNTRTWTVRVVDHTTSAVLIAGRRLLAFGTHGRASKRAGAGVTAYAFDGTRRFHRLDRSAVAGASVFGRFAYLDETSSGRRAVLDMTTSRILRRGKLGPGVIFADRRATTGFGL
jgi:hypothetical protein